MNVGWTVIPVLEFLNGEPWGDRILDFLRAVRPQGIRLVRPGEAIHLNEVTWRVTVYLDESDNIREIEQEVQVELRTADNGHCLLKKIPKGEWPEGPISIVNPRALAKGMKT